MIYSDDVGLASMFLVTNGRKEDSILIYNVIILVFSCLLCLIYICYKEKKNFIIYYFCLKWQQLVKGKNE